MGDKSGAALSTSGMLRLMRELKELRREPPEVLYGLRMNSALGGDMNDEEPNETIGKDGRAQQQKYVERPADAAGSSTDESSSKAAEILFVIRGPDGSKYFKGRYVVKITLHYDHPFKPPRRVAFCTPNGRFMPNTNVCISGLTNHHPESWNGVITLEKIVHALSAFMDTKYDYGIGGIDRPDDEIIKLSGESNEYNKKKNLYDDMTWFRNVDGDCSATAGTAIVDEQDSMERDEYERVALRMAKKRKAEAEAEAAETSGDEKDADSDKDELGLIEEQQLYTYESESELDQMSTDNDTNNGHSDGNTATTSRQPVEMLATRARAASKSGTGGIASTGNVVGLRDGAEPGDKDAEVTSDKKDVDKRNNGDDSDDCRACADGAHRSGSETTKLAPGLACNAENDVESCQR